MGDRPLTELVAHLRDLGTDTTHIEVKTAAGGLPRSVSETISAFANADGGTVILGLDESTGFLPAPGFRPKNIRDALARTCSDDLEPPLRADVDILPFEGAHVVVLDVPPLDPIERPSYVKRKGAYEGSFIRTGDGDRRLTSYEVTQLLSNRRQPEDDNDIVATATLADLDADRVAHLVQRLRSKPTRAFETDDHTILLRAGAIRRDEAATWRPTLAGLLCLGAYPQQFLPQLFVSFVALPGPTLGDALADGTRFLDNVSCDGTIPEMLDAVLAAARRNMRTAAVVRGSGREDRFDYPTEVIRELVVNALLHRDYSSQARGTQVQVELYPDRLVVKSPGGIHGSVVPSQLGVEEVSSTRNAVLAKLLAELPDRDGLPVSENRGSGLPRVMTRLRRAGMSPPQFDAAPGHLHVTVPQHALLDPPTVEWLAALRQPGLTDDQHIALALMRSNGTASNEMLRAWGIESHAATHALRDLVRRGLVEKNGGRRYATYGLAPQSRLPGSRPVETVRPQPGTARSQRLATERAAVIEAIRAGHVTVQALERQLQLTYATANRRVNELLRLGEIEEDAKVGRARTFRIAR